MKIPLLPQGYWQKLRYGNHVTVSRLPDYDGDKDILPGIRDEKESSMDAGIFPHKRLKMETLPISLHF